MQSPRPLSLKFMINCINELKENAIKRQNKIYLSWLSLSLLSVFIGSYVVDTTDFVATGTMFIILGGFSIMWLCHIFDWYRCFHS